MASENIIRLVALIRDKRDDLLEEWRRQVRQLPAAAQLDIPTLNDEVPQLLDNLAFELERETINRDASAEAISAEHGLLRWQAGFDVLEIVAEYNILRICLLDLAEAHDIILSGRAARIVHSLFDDAVGRAIKAFETMMTIELRHRHEEHIAFVLHDLRTPLEAVSLATTLLDRALDKEDKNVTAESALSVLRGNIDRLDDRIKHVLTAEAGLGRSFDPQFTWLNLRDQVTQMVHDLDPIAALADTKVSNEVPADIEIYSEARLLAQILQNLLSNALKFTRQGQITIGASRGTDDAVHCWVSDTGDGIAEERIHRIFDRFETDGPRERRGIGLGLSIVKEIVELHGGEIRVESKEGKGSTFTFIIPGARTDS